MRILHLGKYYPPVPGGMERFLGDLVDAQRAAGHEVQVLVHDDGRADTRDDPPWLHRCPVTVKLFFAPLAWRFPFRLARILREFDPEVIHLHVPNVSAFWVLLLRSALRRRWVVHWQSDIETSNRAVRLLYPHYRIFERALLERADWIVVTSPDYLEASAPLKPWRDKCQVIPLGIAPDRLPTVHEHETEGLWTGYGMRLLAVGRLTYYKGFETLIKAVLDLPNHELVIVGEGEERPALEALLAAAGHPPSVRLLGAVDDATLTRFMASCDVFCLPSIERTESFGIVLLEAMRYAKPLLVSDLKGSGVTWVARNEQNAMVVPMRDPAAWGTAIEALAQHPFKRTLLGLLGFRRYEREFDIAHVAERITQLYEVALRGDLGAAPFVEGSGPEGEDATVGHSERLLVVIPALNEGECIGDVIRQARAHGNVDVLVIDDGSTDDTAAVAVLEGAKVLRAPLWQGAWGAIQTGMRYAVRRGYSAVVTMDADGQHEPAQLPQLVEAAREADVVIAACPSRGSRMRHVAWRYFRFLTGFDLDDLTSGFRYYNARACRLLATEDATLLDYQDIGVLLLLRTGGFRIAEIPVAMNPRRIGASRVFSSWWTVARYMAETTLLCLARWKPFR